MSFVLCVALTATLSACSGGTIQHEKPARAPTNHEALPASVSLGELSVGAKSSLIKYYHVRHKVLADGGAHPERVKKYESAAGYEGDLALYDGLRLNGQRFVGPMKVRGVAVQTYDARTGYLTAHVCDDMSQVHVEDASGTVVREVDPTDARSLLVRMVRKSGHWVFDALSIAGTDGNACDRQ